MKIKLMKIMFANLLNTKIKNSAKIKPTDHSESLKTHTKPIYMNKKPSTACEIVWKVILHFLYINYGT